MDLDPTRLRVMELIQQRRTDLKKASLAIGRNAAYLQQYLYRGIPKTLPEDAREALAAFLGVPEESLRPAKTESAVEPALPQVVAAAQRGRFRPTEPAAVRAQRQAWLRPTRRG